MRDYFKELATTEERNIEKGSFEDEISTNLPQTVSASVVSEATLIMGAIELTKEAINCFTQYAMCKQHEETERKRITAQLKAICYQIDAQKEIYLKQLELQYEERNRLYSMCEKAQESALNNKDNEMLKLIFNFSLNIYNKPIELGGNNKSIE